MTYSYIEHTADVGIRAEGSTISAAFDSGAEAMLNLMFDLPEIDSSVSVTFGVSAPDIPMLFVETLNEVLSIQDCHSLALRKLETRQIEKSVDDNGYLFIGTLHGEKFDMQKHTVKTEVKAATYSGLSYKEIKGKHVIECVLDV